MNRLRWTDAESIAKFFYITIPCIKSTILFALVMLTIGGFNAFTSIKMITGGKPMHKTETVLTWMYYKAFNAGEFGYAAALSVHCRGNIDSAGNPSVQGYAAR